MFYCKISTITLLLMACQPLLKTQGQLTYETYCTTCHNANPAKTGSIGPDLKNSSLELLQAKVLDGEYPDNYSPKKTTKIMPKFPELEGKIDDLYEYLK